MDKIRILLLTAVTALAGDLQTIPLTKADGAIEATTKNGNAQLATPEFLVDVTYPSGKLGKGDVLVVFDRASGLFYWHHWPAPPNSTRGRIAEEFAKEYRAYVADNRLVIFFGGGTSGRTLGISESSRHASSMDDAEAKSLQEAGEHLGEIESGGLGNFLKIIEVNLPLPSDFFAPPRSPAPPIWHLIGVSRNDANWQISLEGQWKAKLTLNDKYEVTATERIQ